jgi:alpha/beta superfamily hydrolase
MLAERGFAVLRFDFTGLGNSEGEFATTTFRSMQDDLKSAIGYLTQNYQAPCFIVGHSFGGTIALSVAQSSQDIKGVVTWHRLLSQPMSCTTSITHPSACSITICLPASKSQDSYLI